MSQTTTEFSDLCDLVRQIQGHINPIFEQMSWAEDEIHHASARHPDHAEALFHSFLLLQPTNSRMSTEFVYRSHCREILDRIASDRDTRPGTAAEICCLCGEISQLAPVTNEAAGLYSRMWAQAFTNISNLNPHAEHYEALYGSAIDDLERQARGKLAQPTRALRDVTCPGRHHGETVDCRYTRPTPTTAAAA